MAHHYYQREKAMGLLGYRVFLEEFDLSSFGDSLVSAAVIEASDGTVVLKTNRDFAEGTLVRVDLHPSRRTSVEDRDGFVVVGCVRETTRIAAGEVYRVEIVMLRLTSERYNAMLTEIEAV